MPVEFLTDEQAEAYGKFAEEPTRPELERFFFLDDVDRDLIALRRSAHHQLGFAVQMCTVRYIGRFLPDDPLVRGLDAGCKQLATRLEEAGPAAKVSIEVQDDGRVKLHVDKLGALGEPKSLTWLRWRVEKMLPKIDLPDLLFEVNAWTVFLDAFVHLGDGTTRMKGLPTSVVALLVSEACNIGLAPVVNPGCEALTRARLVHNQHYHRRRERSSHRRPGRHPDRAPLEATDCLPPWTGCASRCRSAPSTPPRRRSASGSSAASPGSTPSTTRSRASGRWSSPAPRATPCTSWTPC